MIFFSKCLDKNLQAHSISYLEPNEIIQLRLISRKTKCHLDSSKMDHIWRPFINRLKAMDPPISSPDSNIDRSLYYCFKDGFSKINKRQLEEIQHFRTYTLSKHITLSTELTATLDQLEDKPVKTLKELEKREFILNNINEHLIRGRIQLNASFLDLRGNMFITRFPNALFEDPKLKNYWAKLGKIFCSDSNLQRLPNALGLCTSLTFFNCSYNKLESLPESLSQCEELRELDCFCNQLKTLPESLGELKKLRNIYCFRNQLIALPESIGKCRNLDNLICEHNKLKTMPVSLRQCRRLNRLECAHNHLNNIQSFFNEIGKPNLMKQHYHTQKLPDDPMELESSDNNENSSRSQGKGPLKRKRVDDEHHHVNENLNNDNEDKDEDKKVVKKHKKGCWPFC